MDEGLGIAEEIRDKWERADRALALQRRDYWLNLSFFSGEQWVWWHPTRREVAEFPRPKDKDRVRLTINKIRPNLTNLLAKLTKRTLAFEVLASDSSDDVLEGARLGEDILEASRATQDWEAVRYEELFNAFLGSAAAVAIEWDGTAGDTLDKDPQTGKVIGEGEVKLTALSIAEFTLEPGSRTQRDARWWIMARAVPPEQAQETYSLAEKPAPDASGASSPLQRRLLTERGFDANIELCVVYTYYERPTQKNPKGRCTTVIGEQVVDDRPWPFPFKDRLNVRVFRQQTVPRQWWGDTVVNDARPVQAAYNAARSHIAEHMKLAGNARMAVPDTSQDYYEDLTDEPGEIIMYDGVSGAMPKWLEPPHLDRWITNEAANLSAELDDILSVHGISRGEAPGDRNSGMALSVLAEKDETPLGVMAHDQSAGWGDLASMVLELYASKVDTPRTAETRTDQGVPAVNRWTGAMLRGQTRASVPLDNVLPHSRAALQAWVMNLAQNFPQMAASLNGPALARMLDMPASSLFGEVIDADVAKADLENTLMTQNRPILPEQFDDHGKHIAEHNRARKSKTYQFGSRDVREVFDLHVKAHEQLANDEALGQNALNTAMPGAGAVPQAHEPPGSRVPPDFAEQQAAAQTAGPAAGTPSGPPPGMG